MKYFLCTRSKCNVEISGNNTETFPTNYRDYIFVIHGWRSGRNKTWVENVTAAVLKQSDVAIIQVDWSEPADQLYAIAAFINVRAVGEKCAVVKSTLRYFTKFCYRYNYRGFHC